MVREICLVQIDKFGTNRVLSSEVVVRPPPTI